MEKIIIAAFNRFKKRWLKYFLLYLLGILASIVLTILLILAGALVFGIYYLLGQNMVVATILGAGLILAAIFVFIYIGILFNLAQNLALVGEENQNMNSALHIAKPLVLPFLIFNALSSLFMLGLLYTGVLLFIPLLLWAIWGSFSLFAFLDNHRGGLKPLWYSRAKINQNFGRVFLYMAIFTMASLLIMVLLSQLASQYQFINALTFLFFTPFGICFSYELYRSLKEPEQIQAPKIWIGLSIVGYLLIAALAFLSMQNVPKLLKELPLVDGGNIMKQEIPGINIQGWQEN